ncbi:DUF6318 family protein [Rothia dentocariosa]|nr:DUF6318 family protein [Rothia dentocariosa]WMS31299.1 DUF6318 family protein [Rothia dentocariosa]SUE36664.1 Uncharacterised protein [Rothia dentocariosa]
MSSLIVTRRNAALGVLGAGTAAALAACSSSNSNSSGSSSSSSKSEPTMDYEDEVKFDSFDTSAGEYVPATLTEPAKNVPVPKLPENANEKSVEAFYTHIGYYAACIQYLFATGDDTPLRKGSFGETEIQKFSKSSVMEQLIPIIKSGERWFGNPKVIYILGTSQPEITVDSYKWPVQMKMDLGEFVASPNGYIYLPTNDRVTTENADIRGTYTYADNKWDIVSTVWSNVVILH